MSPSPLCSCCENDPVIPKHADEIQNQSEPPMIITTSDFHVSFKEVFILSLMLLLLVYSVVSFLKNWNKNYRDINHFPHFSEDDSQLIDSGQRH